MTETGYKSGPTTTSLHPETIAMKLRQLAAEPDNQLYIARENGCINGIISFLSPGSEIRVTLLAAQTVLFLSSHPNNRELLRSMSALVNNLTQLCTHPNKNLAHFASAALVNLSKSGDDSRGQSFKKKSLESIKLQLRGSPDEFVVKNAILSVAGVVSVSINRKQIATVYSVKKSISFALIEALHNVNVDASEVCQQPIGSTNTPQYLEHQSFRTRPDALSIYADSFEQSTLAHRLARQKQIEREKLESQKQAKSILSKVWTAIW